MKDEIKEILDNPKILMLSYGNYISLDDYVKLKDYITNLQKDRDDLDDYNRHLHTELTNLQEENKQLKELKYKFFDCSGDEESFTLEDYLELGNKLYDLQEENVNLKTKLRWKERIIDKAIELLKRYGNGTFDEELIKLLQGEDNDKD